MRVIISAGGTGGHIYPAIAIINKIKEQEPNSEFLYIGTHNRMEKDIIPKLGIPYKSIEIYGLNKKIFKNFKTLKCLISANKKCNEMIKEFDPDVVIGVGGYVTNPVVKQAKKLGYKTNKGNDFRYNQVGNIIKNEKYVGDYLGQKTYIVSPLTHKRNRNFGEKEKYYVKDHHTPIISRELWNKCQEILNKRRNDMP